MIKNNKYLFFAEIFLFVAWIYFPCKGEYSGGDFFNGANIGQSSFTFEHIRQAMPFACR